MQQTTTSTDSPTPQLENHSDSESNLHTSTDSPTPDVNVGKTSTDILRDVILWKRKSYTVAALLAATAIWLALEVYGLTFITLFSWIAMFLIVSTFLWGNIHMLLGKDPLDMSRMYISDESVVEAGIKFRESVENSLRFLFSVSTKREWFVFAGTVASLGLLSVVASYLDLLTLLYIGIVMGLTVPVVYVKYEDRLKDLGQRARVRCHIYNSAATERCRMYYSSIAERVKKMKSKLQQKKKKKNE
ncbi:reticulon-like protein B13 [Solanum pennellii]|uniref:Reticulon-like protein n=1 Tax=Solanum pennellii TaxID=28526 RepID=A0ABM1V4H4_SOLPN|nr:reticulon-like protein B13 [Solanum pennellii]